MKTSKEIQQTIDEVPIWWCASLLVHRVFPAARGFAAWLKHGAWPFVVFPVVVFVGAGILGCSVIEFAILSIMSAILIVTEMTNFALERICDLVSRNPDGQVKLIKDVAAGAVAVSTFGLLVAAVFIFVGRIWKL